MEWISVADKSPTQFEGKYVLVLVNGNVYLAHVVKRGTLYLADNRFLYSEQDGWHGDFRFSKPTHWMPLPEPPK
jgi:hypothetical protein